MQKGLANVRKSPGTLPSRPIGAEDLLLLRDPGEPLVRRDKNLFIGATCGVLCALCIFLYASDIQAQANKEREEMLAQYGGDQVEVYVAVRDIAPGESLNDSNVEKKLWLGELLPKEALTDLSIASGKTLSAPLFAGEVASMSHLRGSEVEALRVPKGLCAVSVASEPVLAVGGAIVPGQKVNVYSTSGVATDLLARRVEVLSTSSSGIGEEGKEVSWITLAVKGSLVKELIAAAQSSDLYFALPATEP